MEEHEKKVIQLLINKETDIISSEKLVSFPKIILYSLSLNSLEDTLPDIDKDCGFIEFSVFRNGEARSIEEVEQIINKLSDIRFIITNIELPEEKLVVIKKYAPISEIQQIIN